MIAVCFVGLDDYSVQLLADGLAQLGQLFALGHEYQDVVGVGAGAQLESVLFKLLVQFLLFEGEDGFLRFAAQMGEE